MQSNGPLSVRKIQQTDLSDKGSSKWDIEYIPTPSEVMLTIYCLQRNRTPLMEAIRYNEPELVKVLLDFGADAYKQDKNVRNTSL